MILVVEKVLSVEELAHVRTSLASARFGDGRDSAGGAAREQKHVLQLERAGDGQHDVGELVARALLRHPRVQAAVLPKSIRHPTINRYETGMFYGPHLDAPLMRGSVTTRTDVSVTVFLSHPAEYTGGELLIAGDRGHVSVKAAAGDAVLYSSGALHEVGQVIAGVRLVAVTWMQSLIRDPAQRKILFDLGETIASLESQGASSTSLMSLRAMQNSLLRMWLEA